MTNVRSLEGKNRREGRFPHPTLSTNEQDLPVQQCMGGGHYMPAGLPAAFSNIEIHLLVPAACPYEGAIDGIGR